LREAAVQFVTTALDVVGAASLVAFCFLVWPPAALGCAGVLILLASWRLTEGRSE
jgi:hypothetical protein